MTPDELKSHRHALGLSAEGFARVVGVASGRTVRRWERGDRDIPGSVIILITLFLADDAIFEMAQKITAL